MLEMRHSLDSLHRGLLVNRRSGESLARRYTSQLRLASKVQREFLPEDLPRFGPVSFQVLFRPVDYVSGDIYDVRRLDDNHVGIALADASGHGIPAALLTVYIKRALHGKEIGRGTYRILSPAEVLAALNNDILEAHLSACPFVAAVYAVLNTRTREMSLARGGAPYPLCRRADGRVEVIETAGGLVGVDAPADFEVARLELHSGDSVLLYSDGLERIVSPPSPSATAAHRMHHAPLQARGYMGGNAVALDDGGVAVATLGEKNSGAIAESSWCEMLRVRGPIAALEQLSCRQRALHRMGYPLDDLTVVAVQIGSD
jgi:hypothetical protein